MKFYRLFVPSNGRDNKGDTDSILHFVSITLFVFFRLNTIDCTYYSLHPILFGLFRKSNLLRKHHVMHLRILIPKKKAFEDEIYLILKVEGLNWHKQ